MTGRQKVKLLNASLDILYQAYLKLSIFKQFSDWVEEKGGAEVTATGSGLVTLIQTAELKRI